MKTNKTVFHPEEKINWTNKRHIIYTPENSEDEKGYSPSDFLTIAKGNEKLAQVIYDLCEWQHPETVFQELLNDGEIDEKGNILIND